MTTAAGSLTKPEGDSSIPATPIEDLNKAVEALSARRQAWINVDLDGRIRLLKSVLRNIEPVAQRWVLAACDAKGVSIDTTAGAEEWHGGPVLTARNARLLIKSLEDIKQSGAPHVPGPVSTRANGQTVAEVFPADIWDKLLWTGYRAEVWMQPGVTPGNLKATMATAYQPNAVREPELGLVLGAGNVAAIAPTDVL